MFAPGRLLIARWKGKRLEAWQNRGIGLRERPLRDWKKGMIRDVGECDDTDV